MTETPPAAAAPLDLAEPDRAQRIADDLVHSRYPRCVNTESFARAIASALRSETSAREKAEADNAALRDALSDLHELVLSECRWLLDEDSGAGCSGVEIDLRVQELLRAAALSRLPEQGGDDAE